MELNRKKNIGVGNKGQGFTLIEILVTAIIIVLFSGGALFNYHNSSEDKQLEAEAKKFVEALDLTRKKTLSTEKVCAGWDGRWSLVITSTTSYKVAPVNCASGGFSYSLPTSFVFTKDDGTPRGDGTYIFKPFGLGGIEADAKTYGSIYIKNLVLNKIKEIRISAGRGIFYICPKPPGVQDNCAFK